MAKKSKDKPTMAQMEVLVFLKRNPTLRLVQSRGYGSRVSQFAHKDGSWYHWKNDGEHYHGDEKDIENNEPAPYTNAAFDAFGMTCSGWMKSVKLKDEGPFSHFVRYALTEGGLECIEENQERYDRHLAKVEAERQRVERMVILRTEGVLGDNFEFGLLAKVVRETKARLYIERIDGYKGYLRNVSGGGRGRPEYTTKEYITRDNTTEAEFQALRIVEKNHRAWLSDLKSQEDAELNEIRERYRQRRDQNQYAYEDEQRDVLEQVKRNAT